MQGLTLVFHVLSACVILGMTAWIIHLHGTRRFQTLLWGSGATKNQRVYVDWPEVYFSKFCYAISAQFSWDAKAKGQPCPIKPYAWVKAHVQFNILSISLDRQDGIEVTMALVPENLAEWEELLQKAVPRIKKIRIVGQ